jgi:hypothetical protein
VRNPARRSLPGGGQAEGRGGRSPGRIPRGSEFDGVRIEGEPRCEPEHEAVTFSVRNADGKLKRIRVVPSRHQDPEAKTEFPAAGAALI